ncbi:hypothetical protein [Xanthocytophaga flava]|uniref:hypothetical protein n=1 Tax=Xanthocytophaga flava TaxID=3048013 RepID=UPI0028D4703E|nr:hypothetical protein [Xanthocytophaga flavus]MDJ1473606.1 hypothetical protein [Xanthocytophaga flavus]
MMRILIFLLCVFVTSSGCQRLFYKIKYRSYSNTFHSLKNNVDIAFISKIKIFTNRQKKVVNNSLTENFPNQSYSNKNETQQSYYLHCLVKGDKGCDGLYIYRIIEKRGALYAQGNKYQFLYISNDSAAFFTNNLQENKNLLETLKKHNWYEQAAEYEKEILKNNIVLSRYF